MGSDLSQGRREEKAAANGAIRHLRRSELPVATVELARYLVGKVIVVDLPRRRTSGRIVETEAYPPGDSSGHAFRGRTPGNRSLFLAPGHAYVYLAYGLYFLFNVSSEAAGEGGAVLLRALEPLDGIAHMQRRRSVMRRHDLCRGPGRLTAALGIDKRFDGTDLCGAQALWLGETAQPAGPLGASVRIGITREVERRLRFYERGNPFVSGPKQLNM